MDRLTTKAFKVLFLYCLIFSLALPAVSQGSGNNMIKDLKWRNVGPANMIGRISDFEALESNFAYVLCASASGGVFKSVNAGTTWEPIFDKYGSASIGDVALCQSDPDIIWVGTGEECPRNSIAWGDGIYKSTDGGKTFTHMGLKDTHAIGRILIHPENPDIVFVAAPGHTWGYSGDRGLYKTTNGGKTWNKLTNGLPDDGKTGAIDMVIHPSDPDTLYVSFWQRLRQPWRFDSGGPNGGMFKTTDGGATWTKLTQGLPTGDLGRIGLAISRGNPNVMMAVVEHSFQPPRNIREKGKQKPNPDFTDMTKLGTGIYRSEDGGASWMYMNRTNVRPFYYSHIYINPFNDKLVYYLTSIMYMSEDGGKTLKQMQGLHPDFHTMWLDPNNKDRFYVGQDGGASITYDGGKTWVLYDNICVSQFYAISADWRDPYYVYGGLQDNGTWAGPSMSRSGSILTDFWFNIGGGDGFYTQNDPTDWRTVYCESQGGSLSRVNLETRETARIRPSSLNTYNWKEYVKPAPKKKAATQEPQSQFRRPRQVFRFNWSAPILISPHNPHTVFFAANHLFKSVDRGDHWQIISPDLTTNDPSKFNRPTGGITLDQTGAENHCTIISIAESPITPGLIWIGTDDGNVQLTRNGGASWANVRKNVPDVPEKLWVSRVEASNFKAGICYLTFDGHRSDNFKPYVFKTEDFGETWTNISSNLPDGGPVYVIREDRKNKNLLFVGTEFDVFYSLDSGATWNDFSINMPTVAFHDLYIHPRDNDLIAGTHGRGIWILDDISTLQQATEKVLAADAHLFSNGRVGTQWLRRGRGGYGRGNLFFAGDNPPEGAAVSFYLKEMPTAPVIVEIHDTAGRRKTVYTLKDAQAGISRLMWDMQFDPKPAQLKSSLNSMRNLMNRILQRPEVEEAQKKIVTEALEKLKQEDLGYREATAIQRSAYEAIGFGQYMRYMRRGRPDSAARPGTYLVKLTVNDKTYEGKVSVRRDPLLVKSGS